MQFVMIFALVVSILAVVFALQNPEPVILALAVWKFEAPLALFLLISVAIGALLISILTIPGWFRSRQTRSRHNKEIKELEDSLSKYRSNLIDAQNSNKDLRQKIIEIEEAKEALEHAQLKANEEISDLQEALSKADLTAQEAEQARQEALDARAQMDSALRELEERLAAAESVMSQVPEIQAIDDQLDAEAELLGYPDPEKVQEARELEDGAEAEEFE